MGCDMVVIAHEHQKQDRRRQLQQKLLDGRQAQVLVALHLLIVVQESDHPENRGKQKQIDVGQVSLQKSPPAGGDNRGSNADDEHQSAHSGRTGLGGVPLGAYLPDLLTGLQPPQGGQNHPAAQQGRDGEAQNTGNNGFHNSNLPLS